MNDPDHLREWLRRGDAGLETRPAELARLKQRMLAELRHRRRANPARRWLPAAAVVACCVALLLGVTGRWRNPIRNLAPAVEPGRTEQPRQIQFSTPGGTRIIWLLVPSDGRPHDRRPS